MSEDGLATALQSLRAQLGRDLFPLAIGNVDADRHAQKELTGQLDDYLLPRLAAIDAPLLAVVGGSTGAGKSTLVNSLVQDDVTAPGVLRPTTLAPTLVASTEDAAWFTSAHIFPGMPRSTGDGQPGTLKIVTSPLIQPGLALLDAPDIDSVVTANRELAAQLLAAADLWLFVTTASRYADEVPWGFLRIASERSTAMAVILQRVPEEARIPVAADLRRLLKENGLADTPLFEIPELPLPSERARLPEIAVRPIKKWLDGLSADHEARADVVRRTLSGALDSLSVRVPALAEAADRQLLGANELRGLVEKSYEVGMADFDEAMRDGTLLRGEVLARWQDFVGTGDLMRSLETRVGWLRDQIVAAFTGRPAPDKKLRVALESGVESLIRTTADGSAERAVDAWLSTPQGRDLLERTGIETAGKLGRVSPNLPPKAAAAVRDWQGYVLELVRNEGADKRSMARAASFGVNGLGLLIMLTVFASTGGLTGIEIGVAGGTTVLSQKLLEAVFGDQAVRRLTDAARANLRQRVRNLFDEEAGRFSVLLEGMETTDTHALRAAADAVEQRKRDIPGGAA
ncbi:ABC transporter [Herbidospora mongoliensis]|uniref:ABC transporter n=1 Tax=Herbidospora mongoliensis TaxID=688067 RepID=UPI0008316E69|nr:ABC transporter [Herbidospora mongoliensis]